MYTRGSFEENIRNCSEMIAYQRRFLSHRGKNIIRLISECWIKLIAVNLCWSISGHAHIYRWMLVSTIWLAKLKVVNAAKQLLVRNTNLVSTMKYFIFEGPISSINCWLWVHGPMIWAVQLSMHTEKQENPFSNKTDQMLNCMRAIVNCSPRNAQRFWN